MKTIFLFITLLSLNTFAVDQCIDLKEAKIIATDSDFEGLNDYEIDDLINSLKFDEVTDTYDSSIVIYAWPGGHEGASLTITCKGELSYWTGCSGDCD